MPEFKTKERIFIRQIVVEEQAKADVMKAELKKRSIETLAKEYSITPEGKSGESIAYGAYWSAAGIDFVAALVVDDGVPGRETATGTSATGRSAERCPLQRSHRVRFGSSTA